MAAPRVGRHKKRSPPDQKGQGYSSITLYYNINFFKIVFLIIYLSISLFIPAFFVPGYLYVFEYWTQ